MNLRVNKRPQQGVVMFMTLICLVILLVSSVALIRSTDTNALVAGNLSFKRDIVNQAERAMPMVRDMFLTGILSSSTVRENDVLAQGNYYASIQPTNANGVPNVLLNTATFDTTFPNNNIVDTSAQVTIRYVVDRMCLSAGPVTPTSCSLSRSTTDIGGDALLLPKGKVTGVDTPIYRISLRVVGPKNTEVFLQSTFTL